MVRDDSARSLHVSRRAVLAGGATAAAAASSGCAARLQSILNRDAQQQISLSIKTVPADNDRGAIRIARTVADNLNAVGVDAQVQPMAPAELLRDVLINHNFELYVARFPGDRAGDPDFLRPLVHSRFGGEPGWQNPFGFADLDVDDLLQGQQTSSGTTRGTAVDRLQRSVVRSQPFAVLAMPDDISAVRDDRFEGWTDYRLTDPLRYLDLSPNVDATTARVAITDGRVTQNLNPLAVEYRGEGTVLDLIYDPLVRPVDGEGVPWLADRITWDGSGDSQSAVVELREGLEWHDGTSLSAADVSFTYQFLNDTTMTGEDAGAVPAPRYRGEASLVEDASAQGAGEVAIDFVTASRPVARRALTVPVFPRHVWRERTDTVSGAGQTTEAVIWENPQPVGSGPFQFQSRSAGQRIRLSRYDGHFLRTGTDHPFSGAPAYRELVFLVAPSSLSAVEFVAASEADATGTSLQPRAVPRIGRESGVELSAQPSRSFYHIGFNARNAPLSNPNFRRATARLVDKGEVVSEVFDGYATPAVSPLEGTDWLASDLAWNGEDPEVPFFGAGGDLDEPAARAAFRDAGFQYDDEGRLVR
jgi:peptide/nickel transport system substrate-binding protein